jgi:hypothetical protein
MRYEAGTGGEPGGTDRTTFHQPQIVAQQPSIPSLLRSVEHVRTDRGFNGSRRVFAEREGACLALRGDHRA